MELFDAIEARASVRDLEPVAVPAEHLEKILDAGRRAPSGMNAQPLEFLVVRDRPTLAKLGKLQPTLASASAAVFLVADPAASQYWLEDAAAAAENMLLAVAARTGRRNCSACRTTCGSSSPCPSASPPTRLSRP